MRSNIHDPGKKQQIKAIKPTHVAAIPAQANTSLDLLLALALPQMHAPTPMTARMQPAAIRNASIVKLHWKSEANCLFLMVTGFGAHQVPIPFCTDRQPRVAYQSKKLGVFEFAVVQCVSVRVQKGTSA